MTPRCEAVDPSGRLRCMGILGHPDHHRARTGPPIPVSQGCMVTFDGGTYHEWWDPHIEPNTGRES
jgi:hypothetical protein